MPKGKREEDMRSCEAAKVQRVGATTRVVRRGLNGDVTFQSGAREEERKVAKIESESGR